MGNVYPLVSIAICTYNGEKYLKEQLDSLIQQTYQNIEIIAVDDCSIDQTFRILTEYSEKYPFFKVFRNDENKGLSRNFEKALSYCKGDFIAISDQDDIWKFDKIEVLLNNMQDNMLVYAQSETIDENGRYIGRVSMHAHKAYSGSDPRTMAIMNYTWGHNILFRKDLIPLAFPLPEGMDYDWQIGVAALNYGRVQFVNRVLVMHRRHAQNATAKANKVKEKLIIGLHIRLKNILLLKDLQYEDFFRKMLKLSDSGTLFGRIRLFFFCMANMDVLLAVSERSLSSKINVIRKCCYR